ncbi:MAG TPA: TetR/AcrR family transcriptional regulator [Candidatus Polarisedimenticolaceae bacterium]|nr:TetR/AcrR family transcriptional regulator [Candidatus Polarisedimenticolaceae bacterium]
MERREEIARAVLTIIGARGRTALTTTTLAAEVGLTTGALYRHFASLDEILTEAVRYGVERIESTFPAAALPPLDRVLELARNRVRLLGRDRGLAWLLRSEQAYLTLPIHAVIGVGHGDHALSGEAPPDPERVLDTLARLLAPPVHSGRSKRESTKGEPE